MLAQVRQQTATRMPPTVDLNWIRSKYWIYLQVLKKKIPVDLVNFVALNRSRCRQVDQYHCKDMLAKHSSPIAKTALLVDPGQHLDLPEHTGLENQPVKICILNIWHKILHLISGNNTHHDLLNIINRYNQTFLFNWYN